MLAADRPTILFLGANPSDGIRRALEREVREITHRLRSALHGRALQLAQEWALRASDLQACLLEHRPRVVHFSGAGSDAGQLLVEDEQGTAAPVGTEALAQLFGILRRGIRCVVLNACFSAEQARAIARHVDCVIGMGGALNDETSIAWSSAFYQALGYGESVRTAFELAKNQIDLSSLPGGNVPELIEREGVRADQVRLGVEIVDAAFVVPFLQNPGFVGRKPDLEKLHALLSKREPVGVRPAALTGMGGIGKTQLAVEYAYRYRDAYPGGVYWVNAGNAVQAELARLAEKVGLCEADAPQSERQRRLALAFARFLKARPDALLVFDNVDDPHALQTDALGLVPTALGCRLLFTTRRQDLKSPFASVEVSVMPPPAALELLLSSDERRGVLAHGPPAELAEAEAICRTLGYLPLSLVLAAAYLGQNAEIALGDYRGRLAREGALATLDDNDLDAHHLATCHDAAVGATLRLQWDALNGDAPKHIMQTAALLGEAAQVSRATLTLLTGLRDSAEKGYPAPLSSALRKLRELSLVEELTAQAIRLHPLVREFAEQQIADRGAFAAICSARLGEALRDMERLDEEVVSRGIDAVLGDLRLGAGLAGAEDQARFERLIRPLDRETHSLRRRDPAEQPGFFLQQLRNQCFEMELEEVQRRAEAKLDERRWPHLRERFRTSRESEALVRTLEGHADRVNGVAVTTDGRHAVSASWDHSLKVWDLSTGHEVRALHGHAHRVNGVAVTADGGHAVSASHDRTLKVWNLSTGQEVWTLQGHTDTVTGVAVTADGRHAVSASRDRTLKVWDLSTGQAVRTLRGHPAAVSGVAVTVDGRRAVSASADRTLKVWDLSTGQQVRTLDGHTDTVTGVAVAADGRRAVSASADRTLKVWDLSTGHVIRTLRGHTDTVRGVAVTADGCCAVSASRDRVLKVWDLSTGQEVRTFHGHTDWVNGVTVTADGRHVISASSDRTLKIRDLSVDQEACSFKGHTFSATGLAVTADGRHAVSASLDRTLKVWDLSTGHEVKTLEGHTFSATDVAVTADGRHAVSASYDRTLKVWDLSTGQAVRVLQGHTDTVNGVAVTADGRHAISASRDHTLKVWDILTGREIRTLRGHADRVNGVAVTANGRHAVSASADRTLKIWDVLTGREVRTLHGHTSWVNGVALTADGRHAVSASADRTLKVWDLSTGKDVASLHGHVDTVYGVAVTPDSRHAVSASRDCTLKVWDLSTGQAVVTLEAQAPLYCSAVTPDGKTLLAGDAAGAVHILDWVHAEHLAMKMRQVDPPPAACIRRSGRGRLGNPSSGRPILEPDQRREETGGGCP